MKCVESGIEAYLVATNASFIPKIEEKLCKLKLGQRVRIMSVFTERGARTPIALAME